MRNRSATHRNNSCDFSHMCMLFVCIDFVGLVEIMDKSFKDPKKSVRDCAKIANNAMTVLKQRRTYNAFDRFYDVAFRYCDAHDCATKTEVLTDVQKRRKRRNYKDLLNYFVAQGYEGKDAGDKYLHAAIKEKKKVKVIVGNKLVVYDTPGKTMCIT